MSNFKEKAKAALGDKSVYQVILKELITKGLKKALKSLLKKKK
jgi:hypothetical protein